MREGLLLAGMGFIAVAALLGAGGGAVEAAESEAKRPLPAFPGAQGAARYTPGGRGGDVYRVTNLQASGPGSLAYGIASAEGPRTIVFDVSGTIHFEDGFRIREAKRLTIAGQTAPGEGITVRLDDGALRIQDSRHVVLTHLRLANGCAETVHDVLRTDGSSDVLLSHIGIRWGTRGNVVSRADGPLTAQYVINAEPTDRQLAGWYGHMRNEQGLYNQTVRMSLGIHQGGRLNMFQAGRFEFINNVTFNGRSRRPELGPYYVMSRPWHGTAASDLGPQLFDANVIGNVMIDGDEPPAATFGFGRASRVFIDGNVRDRNPDAPFTPEPADADVYEGEVPRGGHRGDQFARVNMPLDLRLSASERTEPLSARQAYIQVLSRGGASAVRDAHDHRYVRDVLNKTLRRVESLDDVPGELFPEGDEGEPPQITAEDGIPDAWKEKHGLDVATAYHREHTEEGYTYLEKYLHSRMHRSFPPDEASIRSITIAATDGEGGHATVAPAAGEGDDDDATAASAKALRVERTDAGRRFGLLRFDLSAVEPGMVNDATLTLGLVSPNGAADGDDHERPRVRVYGLDHDRAQQVWPDGQLSANHAPALEEVDGSLSIVRDELILLGELEVDDDRAKLTSANLAVFLNLAMYEEDAPHSELVTLVLKPLDAGAVTFAVDAEAEDAVDEALRTPRLLLDAVPAER